MSGRRNRQATVPYNPGGDGRNDKVRQEVFPGDGNAVLSPPLQGESGFAEMRNDT